MNDFEFVSASVSITVLYHQTLRCPSKPPSATFSLRMKLSWPHTDCSWNIPRNNSPLWERTRRSLVEEKLGKLRWMWWGFCPVSIFALRRLSSFCISINCFSVRCYLTVLLACREATRSSLWRTSTHLLTQFVWHYCPSFAHGLVANTSVWCADVHIKPE